MSTWTGLTKPSQNLPLLGHSPVPFTTPKRCRCMKGDKRGTA